MLMSQTTLISGNIISMKNMLFTINCLSQKAKQFYDNCLSYLYKAVYPGHCICLDKWKENMLELYTTQSVVSKYGFMLISWYIWFGYN